jgi:hypothetical protein
MVVKWPMAGTSWTLTRAPASRMGPRNGSMPASGAILS